MRASSVSIGISLLLGLFSCIDPYEPDIGEMQDLMVVNGYITDVPGEHRVEVSRTSPYNYPAYIPVEECVVRVEDNYGEGVTYEERSPGVYAADLDEPFLGVGKAYKLYVFTMDGKEYQSDYDSMLPCPKLENLVYKVEKRETENPLITHYGIQFYVDVKGGGNDSRNFLWKMEETFEYHSTYLIQYIWNDGDMIQFIPPTDSLYICYRTQSVKEVYTASTRYLAANELHGYPLNFVSNQTNKLLIKYSLLVRQYSLSEDAFLYWDRITRMLNESGGLYETQPSVTYGNTYNANDAEEKVLGYFYASQVKEKRLTTKERFDFPIPRPTCDLDTISSFSELQGGLYYLISLNEFLGVGPPYGTAHPACFNCRLRGGTTEPPEWWYDEK